MSYTSQSLLLHLGLPIGFGAILGLAAYFYNQAYGGNEKMMALESVVIAIVTGVLMWFIVRSVSSL